MRLLTLALIAGCGAGLSPMDAPATSAPGDGSEDSDEPIFEDTGSGPGNGAPVAVAGADLTVALAQIVTLDGAASSDPDGDPLAYAWEFTTLPTGSGTTLFDETTSNPTFFADRPGSYAVRLTVDDGDLTAFDDVLVLAEAANGEPFADAGPDQSVTVGDQVSLNGSASFDPDNDPLNYSWTFASVPVGSSATLSNASSALPTFVADVVGVYRVELVVSDGGAPSAADEVLIEARGASSGSDCGSCLPPAEVARRLSTGHATFLLLIPFALRRRIRPPPTPAPR